MPLLLQIFLTFLLLLSAETVLAQQQDEYEESSPGCHVTPKTSKGNGGYPGKSKIMTSNKLALPAGKGTWAPGDLVYLYGRVLDENCVPISDATIEIWQTNAYGEHRWITPGEASNPYPAFAGTGRAVTDSLGRYSFITIFPGPHGKRAPHIHLRITHENFRKLTTEMFFKGDRRNKSDSHLNKVPENSRKHLEATVRIHSPGRPEAGIEGHLDFVLKGKNQFSRF